MKKNRNRKDWKAVILKALIYAGWVFSACVVSELLIGYLLLWVLGRETFSAPVWTTIYSALAYGLSLFLVIFIPQKLFKKWKTSRRKLGLLGLPTWTDIGLSIVGFIVALILSSILTNIFNIFPWFNIAEAQDTGFNVLMDSGERILAFFTLVVVAPIFEEIIFRGWLYDKLRKSFSEKFSEKTSVIIAILIVSLLFGIVHFQWNVGVTVFALSIVMCCLREVTGTIYAGILMHMIKNAVAFYLLYVLQIV